MDLINNPDVLKLARKLKDIDMVEQIRFWPVMKKKFVDQHGDNTVVFNCLIKSNAHSEENDKYVGFWRVIAESNYRDENFHSVIVKDFVDEIEEYRKTGVFNNPTDMNKFSPYSGT